MGFQQNNNSISKLFLKNNREILLKLNFPLELIEDENKWNYYLLHGNYPGIDFTITIENKNKLLSILQEYYPKNFGISI